MSLKLTPHKAVQVYLQSHTPGNCGMEILGTKSTAPVASVCPDEGLGKAHLSIFTLLIGQEFLTGER